MLKRIFCFIFLAALFVNAQTVLINTLVADLKVEGSQVSGEAKGLLSDEENLKKEAVGNAIKNNADVLVDVSFFLETQGDSLTVKALGFPAYYTNFHSVGQKKLNGLSRNFYFSARYLYALSREVDYYLVGDIRPYFKDKVYTRYESGGVIEIGGSMGILFISGELGGGEKNFGGGVSLGAQISPLDRIGIVTGYWGGCWIFMIPYRDGFDYDIAYPAFHGPFAKLLFGKDKYWFEINYRFLFERYGFFGNQISAGFTYIKAKNRYWR